MTRLRLPHVAVAFAVGVWLAGGAAKLAVAPAPWLWLAVLTALVALGRPRSRLRNRLLMVAALAAGGGAAAAQRAALVGLPGLPDGVFADDRIDDSVVGVVVGPVVDSPRARRFTVSLDPPAAGAVEVSAREHPNVLPGDRVRVTGRLMTPRGYRVPGAVDRRAVVARRGAQLVMSTDSAGVRVAGRERSAWRAPARAQRWASATIEKRRGAASGRGIVRAMVAGDRGGVEASIAQRFRHAGIAHVLAVSGLHLAATAMLFFVAVRRLWAAVPALALRADATRAAALCAAPAAVAYAVMTGARPSTLRALVVVLCVLGGAALRRRPQLLDSLGFAAIVLLVVSPVALFDPGFQLSFVATATLAVVAISGRWLWSAMRATLWVTLATAPIAAATFGTVQTGGVLANLVAVPVAALLILPVGLAGLALSTVWEAGGGVLLDLAIAAATALSGFAGWVADVFPVLRISALSSFELAAAVTAIGLLVLRTRRAALLALVPAAALAVSYAAPRAPDGVVVTFLDVGQGDAAVVELPGGEVWLVDAGGRPFVGDETVDRARQMEAPGEHSVLRFLAHRRIRHLDLVVLSHAHPDHHVGLRAIARHVSIGEVWVAEGTDYRDALDGMRVVHPPLGRARVTDGAVLEVLAPRYESSAAEVDPIYGVNDNSLVVALRFGGRRVLFAGDLEAEGEELLLAALARSRAELAADVVKVAHHGSGTSSTAAFIDATGARSAVISCGRANRFGFPAAEVEARWRERGARVFRTDRDGAVTVRMGAGGHIGVSTFD